MIKLPLLILFLLISAFCHADWGTINFLKCKITTADTVVIGYFAAFHEQTLPDSVLLKLKTDQNYFNKHVVNKLNNVVGLQPTFELNRFIYVHKYYHADSKTWQSAIFRSTDKLNVSTQSIIKMELLDILVFQFVPNTVISTMLESDNTWMREPVKKVIQSPDKCYPYRFLIYDDTVDYNSIIKEIMNESDKKDKVLKNLRENRIVGLQLNLCS
jgi:hypothetical protein